MKNLFRISTPQDGGNATETPEQTISRLTPRVSELELANSSISAQFEELESGNASLRSDLAKEIRKQQPADLLDAETEALIDEKVGNGLTRSQAIGVINRQREHDARKCATK